MDRGPYWCWCRFGASSTPRATESYVPYANNLLPGLERVPLAVAGRQGIQMRLDPKVELLQHVVMQRGKKNALGKRTSESAVFEASEKLKAGFQAKAGYLFWIIERKFGRVKMHYRGLKNNTRQFITLFGLSSLSMVRRKLTVARRLMRLKMEKSA